MNKRDIGLELVKQEVDRIFKRAMEEKTASKTFIAKYIGQSDDRLNNSHDYLFKSLTREFCAGDVVINDIRVEELNELLEITRELTLRELK